MNNTCKDKDLTFDGYSLLYADHPNNVKKILEILESFGYSKETLAPKMLPIPN